MHQRCRAGRYGPSADIIRYTRAVHKFTEQSLPRCFRPANALAKRPVLAREITRFGIIYFSTALAQDEGHAEPRPYDASSTPAFRARRRNHDGHQPDGQWDDPFGRGRARYAVAL